MNTKWKEPFEELAERATAEMDPEAFSNCMDIPAEWYLKYAELIVKQCIAIAHDYEDDRSKSNKPNEAMAAGMVAYKMARYFGVKE